jgi:predicted dehydrogenase
MKDLPMSERTRLGVIGCGFFARNHLHSWKDLHAQGVDLTAVCDIDPEKAKAAAAEFGVPHWYDSPEAMFAAESLDLVDIVTQVRSHKALVELAIEAGVATIVQKPFGNDLSECRAMVAVAEKAGKFLAVHENFRYQRAIRMVSEIIASGAIGEPNWGRISFRTGYDIYAGQPYLLNEERFVVTDLGVHVLDLARVFFGEVDHLSAELQKRNPKVRGEDTATMMLRHASGAVSVVECTYESRRIPDAFPATLLEIEGTKGAIAVHANQQIDVTSEGTLTSQDGDAPVLPWAARPWHVIQESVYATCEHILQRFRAGQPADISGADNFKTYALCEAAYASAASGHAEKPEA